MRTIVFLSLWLAARGGAESLYPAFELVDPELFSVPGGQPNAWADFDGDGDLDLFVAGANAPYRNEAGRRFTRVETTPGGPPGSHAVTSSWGDFDNDGQVDLYIAATVNRTLNYTDYLFRNKGGGVFSNVLPELVRTHDATHGVQWVDFDADGDLDLSLTGNGATDGHYLLRNLLPSAAASRWLAVSVLDGEGRRARAGAEVRLYRAGTRELLGTRILDTGSGYCPQSTTPVHFNVNAIGIGEARGVRRAHLERDVRVAAFHGRTLVLRE